MLVEICCKQFCESPIEFKEGLNIILGDPYGKNSIGKSSLLLIIDYVFGGSTYIKFDSGSVANIGEQKFYFCFDFNGQKYNFMRDTTSPETICICNNKYNIIGKQDISSYISFLRSKYDIEKLDTSFREFVTLFSRVWGKNNLIINLPLHNIGAESHTKCIIRLIKFFDRYKVISESELEQQKLINQKQIIDKASAFNLVRKINKNQYKINNKQLEEQHGKMEKLKRGLAENLCNINELLNDEIIDLKLAKDDYSNRRAVLKNKILRLQHNLDGVTLNKSNALENLIDIFPNINIKPLEEIQKFHSTISSILTSEFTNALSEFEKQLIIIDTAINELNKKISNKLSYINNPVPIVDQIVEMNSDITERTNENNLFDRYQQVKEDLRNAKTHLLDIKEKILTDIAMTINIEIQKLSRSMHCNNKNTPTIKISPTKYEFFTKHDSGTGQSFLGLLLFDIAIFYLTKLPIVIHDSLLFKNIEIRSLESLLHLYTKITKQSFISIDATHNFNDDLLTEIHKNMVVYLHKSKLLFNKNWKARTNDEHS